ncbi:MAG: methyl-accepting chemotaxis protein [Janthinobacterium lividum]
MHARDFKISARLALAFGFIVALMILTALLGVLNLNFSTGKMNLVVKGRYPLISLSNDIKSNGYKASAVLSNLLIASTPEQKQQYMDAYADIRSTNATAYTTLQGLLSTDKGRKLFDQQIQARNDYGAAVKQVFAYMNAGQQPEAVAEYQGDMARLQSVYYALVDRMVEYQAGEMAKDVGNAADNADYAKIEMAVLSAFAVLISVVTAIFITRTITTPINQAVALAEAVAQGDLAQSVAVEGNDEVSRLLRALKNMIDNLHGIVGQVRSGTDTIATAAREIAGGSRDLAGRTEQQASSLGQTVSAMEQLTTTVKLNADNARQASQLALSASTVATHGGGAVDHAVDTMNAINQSSAKIVEIISLIDGIAFQTNILALNAAVEAARAGEHGRGFAVVATEVRNLAQRSAAAAKEIKELINDSVGQVSLGKQSVEEAGKIIREVVSSIKQVTDIVSGISVSMQEQSDGIGQINGAVMQVDRVTQENSALVEESSAAAHALQEQAGQLTDMVRAFRLDR